MLSRLQSYLQTVSSYNSVHPIKLRYICPIKFTLQVQSNTTLPSGQAASGYNDIMISICFVWTDLEFFSNLPRARILGDNPSTKTAYVRTINNDEKMCGFRTSQQPLSILWQIHYYYIAKLVWIKRINMFYT